MKLNSLVIYTDQTVIMFFFAIFRWLCKTSSYFYYSLSVNQWTVSRDRTVSTLSPPPPLSSQTFIPPNSSECSHICHCNVVHVGGDCRSDSLGLLTHFYNLLCWYRPGQHWVTHRGVNWEIICTAVYTPVYTAVQTLNKARSPPDTAPSLVQLLTGLCIKYILIVRETSETSETVETLPPCNN